jgi:hypothetical protein
LNAHHPNDHLDVRSKLEKTSHAGIKWASRLAKAVLLFYPMAIDIWPDDSDRSAFCSTLGVHILSKIEWTESRVAPLAALADVS